MSREIEQTFREPRRIVGNRIVPPVWQDHFSDERFRNTDRAETPIQFRHRIDRDRAHDFALFFAREGWDLRVLINLSIFHADFPQIIIDRLRTRNGSHARFDLVIRRADSSEPSASRYNTDERKIEIGADEGGEPLDANERENGVETLTTTIAERDRLIEALKGLGKVAVAFSGGVDSTVVAKAAQLALGDNAIAVTAVSQSLAEGELENAEELAAHRHST